MLAFICVVLLMCDWKNESVKECVLVPFNWVFYILHPYLIVLFLIVVVL